jgi:hypothetical protein
MEGSVVLQVHRAFSEDDSDESDDGYNSDYGSSESDDGLDLLSSNRGIMYNHKGFRDPSERLLDFTKAQDYETSRNKYFTPEITKHTVMVGAHTSGESVDLTTFGFPIYRVIGFKVVKAGFTVSNATDGRFVDIIIDEIPYLACVKNTNCKHLVARCPQQSANSVNYLYFENKNIFHNTYFTPIKLPTLTITLQEDDEATEPTTKFIEFEITVLNAP